MALVFEVFGYGQLQIQASGLEDDASLLPGQVWVFGDIEAEDARRSACWDHEGRQDAEQSGLLPLGPNRPKISAGCTAKLRSSRARRSP